MKRLILATNNAGKGREMAEILREGLRDIPILTLADLPGFLEPEENGSTYAENAIIKARSAADQFGEIAIGDDVGLEIDALNVGPGLHSKRFAGESTFPEKMRIILDRLDGVPEEDRTARFRCAIAIAEPGGPVKVCQATLEGRIAEAPRGSGGFGYDPIFYLPTEGCTIGELPPGRKNQISHRARTLALAIPILRHLFGSATNE